MSVDLRRPIWLALALVLGAGAGLLLVGRDRAGELTSERLSEARRVWRDQAPASYQMELEIRGALNETRTVVVRAGRVVSMTAGGVEMPESAWEYWSVDGLFDVLATEVANAADPKGALGSREVALLARFEPTWGYPAYFYRHIMGTANDIEWEVASFIAE